MRMSCNGCRVLRKGCSENCSIRPCLQWIKSPESQANATVFLAKFYGRAGLMNLVNAGPEHLRPAIFRSLLYEACGRIVNPIYGSVGLLWSGSWQLCQAAVEAVLKGAPITPITSEAAANGRGPPLKAYDIRHVTKDDSNSALSTHNPSHPLKTRSRKRSHSQPKPKPNAQKLTTTATTTTTALLNVDEVVNHSASLDHESSLSHQSELATAAEGGGESKERESESIVSVETTADAASVLFRDEPESNRKRVERTDEDRTGLGLDLTLGFEPVSSSARADHVVPVKKRRFDLKDYGVGSGEMGLGLECPA
ncbi:LOB domain-containing protein 41 [Arachis duranensis]|uniref:LOB domain-containing protein 41 n=1 Tax=Arachis duranensis TaxID=130453 RepID=A0A6P4DCQ5_ARADU|nr:LOB domain-containing protein 41 [Arachis duranensis]